MRLLLGAAVLLLAGVSGCGSAERAGAPATATPTAEGSSACTEVLAGVDAFNQGDYASTVAHFRKAVPLAEAEAKQHPSPASDLLVEAVTYYADLAPRDYPESARSSLDFEKYKQVTLGQCDAPGREPPTESPGQVA